MVSFPAGQAAASIIVPMYKLVISSATDVGLVTTTSYSSAINNSTSKAIQYYGSSFQPSHQIKKLEIPQVAISVPGFTVPMWVLVGTANCAIVHSFQLQTPAMHPQQASPDEEAYCTFEVQPEQAWNVLEEATRQFISLAGRDQNQHITPVPASVGIERHSRLCIPTPEVNYDSRKSLLVGTLPSLVLSSAAIVTGLVHS